jgi:hypothetical protein
MLENSNKIIFFIEEHVNKMMYLHLESTIINSFCCIVTCLIYFCCSIDPSVWPKLPRLSWVLWQVEGQSRLTIDEAFQNNPCITGYEWLQIGKSLLNSLPCGRLFRIILHSMTPKIISRKEAIGARLMEASASWSTRLLFLAAGQKAVWLSTRLLSEDHLHKEQETFCLGHTWQV